LSSNSSAEAARSVWPVDCFAGRSVLVSGGSSGIGAAIAAAFVRAEAIVTFTGATQREIDAALSNPSLEGAKGFVMDVRDPGAVADLVAAMPELHHVVNCAGIILRGEELDPDVFAGVVDINLTGMMRVCAAARPRLAASGGGTITNTASMLSFFGGGLVPAYAASKGGVAQLTKSLAIAYAADGIRVNAIAPGWIKTPLTAGLVEDPERSGAILARTPLRRWGEPDDVVGGVLFLASPMAAFVTGAILAIDGGYLIA
jgi:NAD(P)-dependent dehydrogenase (short-subunit alcohol dehydrogenase family)